MTAWRRAVLVLLTLQGLFVGGWALLGPRSWYDTFPGLGLHWTRTTGPYNEHFVTDIGAAYLALAAVAVLALAWNEPRIVQVAGAIWAVFSAPHFLFHALHLDGLDTVDAVGQLASLGATLAVAVALAAVRDPSS